MRRRKWSIDVGVGVALLALTEVVIWANPFVSFGVAVAAATGWCIWLDRDSGA